MGGRKVVGPDGREWRISRRWLPWEPRRRVNFSKAGDALQGIDIGFDLADSAWGIVAAIAAAILLVLFVIFVLPIIVTILEVLIVLILLPLFVVARVVLRKPWIVIARTKGPPPERRAVSVQGWRASQEAMVQLAQEIQIRDKAHRSNL